jgi:ComF family protein
MSADLCQNCKQELPILENYCNNCAELLPKNQTICGKCLNKLKNNLNILIPFHYITPIDKLIMGLKFNNQLKNANILGSLLAEYLCNHYQNSPKPEIIIPVPLHVNRLKERGYNQALELSYKIKKIMNIPIDKTSVIRIKNTSAQALLKIQERTQNVKKAFAISRPINYRYAAIVDDVTTTGSTIYELCKTLYNHSNIQKIDVWCIAKSLLK